MNRREDYVSRGLEMLQDPIRLRAGLEYTQSISSLGLDPDLSCWVYLPDEDRAELAIVTTMIDRIGPTKIYNLLFRAYDLSATPHEINPFDVGLYSPLTALGIDLLNSIRVNDFGYIDWVAGLGPKHIWRVMYHIGLNETKLVSGVGIYRVKSARRNADQDRAKWSTFNKNVLALAA